MQSMHRWKQLSRNSPVTLRRQMNMIWLNQPGRPCGSYQSICLDDPDATFAKLLLNCCDVRLTGGKRNFSPIVAAKLQDNDLGTIRNGVRQPSQHAVRCISEYACIRDAQAGS